MKNIQSDFRYNTGNNKVPWPAIGESVTVTDVMKIVSFLIQPGEDKRSYDSKLSEISALMDELASLGNYAGKLSLGNNVKKLEQAICKMLDCRYACFMANWTGGMELALRLCGLGPDDEIIVPSNTFIATILWPLSIKAKIVFADIDPVTVNMDPDDVARKITDRTKVIIPVHIGGYPVNMKPIMELATKYGIAVLEDAAHGFGAKYCGKYLGTIGDFGGYSFHEVKNITSLGEGGVLVSNNTLGEQFSKGRFCGLDFSRKIKNWLYDVTALQDRFGSPQAPCNYSVTEIQAIALMEQMNRIDGIIAARRNGFEYLCDRLEEVEEILPPPKDTTETYSSHHLFLLRLDIKKLKGDVQSLKSKLAARGVTEIQHFAPLYKFEIIREMGYDQKTIADSCPNTEDVFAHGYTHLPLYGLDQSQFEIMVDSIIEAVKELAVGK